MTETVHLCRGCAALAHPDISPDAWMYLGPDEFDGEGCWGCGATDVPLMPRGEALTETGEENAYQLGNLTIHRYLGTGEWTFAQREDDDHDDD
jgi:hypothetical protein